MSMKSGGQAMQHCFPPTRKSEGAIASLAPAVLRSIYACNASNVLAIVEVSVCPSVRHTLKPYQNGAN